jgi:hypothetical protein
MKRKPEPIEWIAGDDAGARATAFAGLLAELDVQRLTIEHASGVESCLARVTDLPGLLAKHAPCTVRFDAWSGGGACVYAIDASGIRRQPCVT